MSPHPVAPAWIIYLAYNPTSPVYVPTINSNDPDDLPGSSSPIHEDNPPVSKNGVKKDEPKSP